MNGYQLPKNWKIAQLGKCCKVVSGATPRRNVPEYWDGDIPWVTPKDLTHLEKPVLQAPPEFITKEGFKSCSTVMVPKGTVLFSSRAPIGLVAIAGQDMCTNQGFKSLVPGKDVNSAYLYHCMKWMAPRIADMGNGATFKEVSGQVMNRVEIPLPPLSEQRRIAAILDKADAIRKKRREAIALADEFLRSAFLEMFGDPVTNPKGWEVKKAIDVCDCIVPGRDKPKSFTGTIPWITTDDLSPLELTSASGKAIGLTDNEIKQVKARKIPKGSVLMTCVGDLGLVSISDVECVVNQQLHTFQCREAVNNIYLMYALSFQKPYFFRVATNTTVPYLNKTNCNSTPVPIPSKALQQKFAKIALSAWKAKETLESASKNNDHLFHSLTKRAFRGEL